MSSDEAKSENAGEDGISTLEVLGWIEVGSWTVLALIPFLSYVNGPAVSRDQFVVRCMLGAIAVIGGVGLSVRRVLLKRIDRNL